MGSNDILTPEELDRYDRQIMIQGFGTQGQERLKKARVLIAGTGGLGCPVSTYLTAAGVGKLRILDYDRVSLSNLNRQVLHWEENQGHLKTHSAAQKLARLNSTVKIEVITEKLTQQNFMEMTAGADVIVDALDNFETRILLNKGAVYHQIPFIYGGVNGLVGMTTTMIPHTTPCLSCIFPHPAPQEKFPVLGTTPAVIGCIQATEVIKYITGLGNLLTGRLLIYNGEDMSFNEVTLERDPDCPVCGNGLSEK